MARKRLQMSATPRHENLTICRQMLGFWNLSEDPEDNSDLEKIFGKGGPGTVGMAILDFDDDTRTMQLADGYHGKKIHGRRPMDPHNYVPRIHSKDGKGNKSVWSHRSVVDSTNKDHEREHRSMIYVDACQKMTWSFARDLEYVLKFGGGGASVDHEEIKFDDAGFLPAMTGKNKGKDERGVRSINMSKRGAYISDKAVIAQLWHILHIAVASKPPKPVKDDKKGSRTGKGPGRTVAEDRPSEPGETEAAECGVVSEAFGVLRGDVEWQFKTRKAHLAMDCENPYPQTEGEFHTGWFYIDPRAMPCPPVPELSEDDASNQKILPRALHESIRPVVLCPREWFWVPEPVVPPPCFPNRPSPCGSPNHNSGCDYAGDDYENCGVDIGTGCALPVPEDLDDIAGCNLEMNILLPAVATAGIINFRTEYYVQGPAEDVPAAIDGTFSDSLPAGSGGGGTATMQRFNVFIPPADVQGKQGGKVHFAFYRSGSDDQLDTLKVIGQNYRFGSEVIV